MIKCFFIDVKSISSAVPISSFDKSKIERLADAILANDGLISPLILMASGLEEYTVVAGDLEYYAAVRAKEKDARKAEMVNAFVIPANNQQAAIEQLTLLSEHKPVNVTESRNIIISIDQLTTIISQQLQPLQQELVQVNRQLTEQKQILASISSHRIDSIDIPAQKPAATNLTTPEIVEPVAKSNDLKAEPSIVAVPEKTAKQPDKQPKSKQPAKVTATKQDKNESADKVDTPTASIKSATTKKTPASAKSKPELDPSIDPIKAANTLNLINTLSPADLQFRLEKSGLPAGTVKFVSSIINQREAQPGNQFANWEIIMSEVSGVKAATAKNIINKLK
jgi:hypothetical protein